MSENIHADYTRRKFLRNSFVALMAAGAPEWLAKEADAEVRARAEKLNRRFAQNDTIQIGVIGPGGSRGGFRQGLGDTRWAAGHSGVKVVAACDVDGTHLNEAAETFGSDCKKFKDYRELLAQKDIDAVVIGTPDHWHTTIALAAMKAGKDVYCEKPLTLTIDEGKRLVKVARDTKRVFQVGSQQRSDARFRLACELVRNGRIGKLKRAIAHLPGGSSGGPFPVTTPPSDFDWDMWLGPAPWTDYIKERTHGSFRHWLEYSGGMMTDWGAHHNDIAQWGLGMDRSGPVAVESIGVRRSGPGCFNAFLEFDVTYTYANGVTLLATNKGENGVDFEGEEGSIFVSRGTLRASDPQLLEDPLPANATRLYRSDDHMGNWLDCIRSRKQPICDVETGHRSVSVCHLGNISLRLGGRRVEWDPVKEMFKNDAEANAMLARAPRKSNL